MNTDKKILKKIDESIDIENANYILLCLKLLEENKQKIYDLIAIDYTKLKNDIDLISLGTTLNYKFTDNELIFESQNPNNFMVKINDGKCFFSKKTGFNYLYFEIVEKYKKTFDELAITYKKIKPYLLEIKQIDEQKKTINGNNLYKLYIKEEQFNKKLIPFIKQNNITIEQIKEKIYDKTGWYYLEDDIFGQVDVDAKIIKGVILKNKWIPCSDDKEKIKEEELFILDNIGLLNNYKLQKSFLNDKLKEKNKISIEIQNEINSRNNLIEELKKEINSQEKVRQKVI